MLHVKGHDGMFQVVVRVLTVHKYFEIRTLSKNTFLLSLKCFDLSCTLAIDTTKNIEEHDYL